MELGWGENGFWMGVGWGGNGFGAGVGWGIRLRVNLFVIRCVSVLSTGILLPSSTLLFSNKWKKINKQTTTTKTCMMVYCTLKWTREGLQLPLDHPFFFTAVHTPLSLAPFTSCLGDCAFVRMLQIIVFRCFCAFVRMLQIIATRCFCAFVRMLQIIVLRCFCAFFRMFQTIVLRCFCAFFRMFQTIVLRCFCAFVRMLQISF